MICWIVLGVVVFAALLWFLRPLWTVWRDPHPLSYHYRFLDPSTNTEHDFPSLFSPHSVDLSLIVPAYNEELRLRDMMNETLGFLGERKERHPSFSFEVIIVDDGSRDSTAAIAMEYSKLHSTDRVRVLVLDRNQGKGGAVQQGMLHARGSRLLMVDADGATRIEDLERLETAMDNAERDGFGIAVGSRAHLAAAAVRKRKWYRNLLMYGFNLLVSTLCVRGVKDTQCGFKLFSRKAARVLFANQHLRRWCFDVELLHIAQRVGGIPIQEVAVNWTEVPGSKLSVITASLQMGREMVLVSFAYATRLWRVQSEYSKLE